MPLRKGADRKTTAYQSAEVTTDPSTLTPIPEV
jgi:hypothetical protein